ncbi:MAG: helicase RepA family protein [Verrucomicrobiota bacterium]
MVDNSCISDSFHDLPISKFFSEPRPKLDFVFPGLLAGTVGSIVSAGGVGKSMLAMQLAANIAGGGDTTGLGWVPACSKPGKAVYMPAEDPEIVLQHRFSCLGDLLSEEGKARIIENLRVSAVSGMPNFLSSEWFAEVCRRVEGARILFLDTFRRFHNKDENSSGEMTLVIGALERVAKATGSAVLFLHHTNKGAALNGTGAEQQSARGSSVLTDNVRWQANLTGMTKNEAAKLGVHESHSWRYVKLTQSKVNYCPSDSDLWLQRGPMGFLSKTNSPNNNPPAPNSGFRPGPVDTDTLSGPADPAPPSGFCGTRQKRVTSGSSA